MDHSGFVFVGNQPWLDLVNTEPVREGARVDLLRGPDELLRWLEAAGILDAAEAGRISRRWSRSGEGREVHREAIALRGALRAMAERLVDGALPGADTVTAINRVLASRPAVGRLQRSRRGFTYRLEALGRSPLHLLVPVAESAATMLERGEGPLVRRCEGTQCVLFFYDTTRNRSRRWCSMEGCGGRAKAAAYYRRTVKKGVKRKA